MLRWKLCRVQTVFICPFPGLFKVKIKISQESNFLIKRLPQSFMIINLLEENNYNFIYIFTTFQHVLKTFLTFLFPTPQNFPSLEIYFFIFQVLKVFLGAWEPCYRLPQVKNQTKTEKISIITPKKMCDMNWIWYVLNMFNLYVIGIMFTLLKNQKITIAFHDHLYLLEENNSNFIYILSQLSSMFPGLSHIFLLPTTWNFPGLEIHFFIFHRFSRFSRVHVNPALDFLQPRIKQKVRKYP